MIKKIMLFSLLVICFSCGSGPNLNINGKWKTEGEHKSGKPLIAAEIEATKKSIIVILGGQAYDHMDNPKLTGVWVEGNKFELSNSIEVNYNEELDKVYIKWPEMGVEFIRE